VEARANGRRPARRHTTPLLPLERARALKHFDLPNTPANRDVVVEWLAKVLCTRKDPR
jgi:hypothetical protein